MLQLEAWSLRRSSSYWTYNRRGEWELAGSRGRTAAGEIFRSAWDFRGNKAEERERERISSCDQLPQGLIMALLAKWCCRGRASEEMWVVSSLPLFGTSSVLPTTLLKVSSSGDGGLARIMWKQRLGWSYTEVLQDWIWAGLLLPPYCPMTHPNSWWEVRLGIHVGRQCQAGFSSGRLSFWQSQGQHLMI